MTRASFVLIGIGTGDPAHLTLQAIRAINAADLILLPRKAGKADLADLRREICATVLIDAARPRIAEFDMPVRAGERAYRQGVDDWHDAVANVWAETIATHLPAGGTVALLVWGDPALYDSTLRIAGRLVPLAQIRSIPGLMSPNVLAAAHGIALNEIGAPFLVTTGRQLRDHGWPAGVDTLVVMLDGDCAFRHVAPDGVTIWWGAYVGMAEQILRAGPLGEIGAEIVATRAAARARHGWIMDIYILRRAPG